MRIRLRALVLLFSLVGLAGCRGGGYARARAADSPEAYRAYLRAEPKSEEAAVAQTRLAELEFAGASKAHTVVAYKRFLEEFPDALRARAARALLEGLRFNAAREQGTVQAWHRFLEDHPDGAHHGEAEQALADAELQLLSASGDRGALERVAATHADDARGVSARAVLDDRSFEAARLGGSGPLLAYLAAFPAGAHRDSARVILLDRRIDGLLFSGEVAAAKEEVARAPLASQLPDLQGKLARAERIRSLAGSREPLVRSVQVGNYLRSLEDLTHALSAADPLERWQAAEELGQHISILAIDPLLIALRSSRHLKVRMQAFDSLGQVLRALPQAIREHEVATRLQGLRTAPAEGPLSLAAGALLELSNRRDEAVAAYRQASDRAAPDPFLLWREAHLQLEKKQHYPAAVAARQLALWASASIRDLGVSEPYTALATSRALCSVVAASHFALQTLDQAGQGPSEFPDDLTEFKLRAAEVERLARARLQDAELMLRSGDSSARTCDDAQVSERLIDAERRREEALEALPSRLPRLAPELLVLVGERDPSLRVRALATRLQKSSNVHSPGR